MIRKKRQDHSLNGLSEVERFCKRQLKGLVALTQGKATLAKQTHATANANALSFSIAGTAVNAIVVDCANTKTLRSVFEANIDPLSHDATIFLNEPNYFHEKVFHKLAQFLSPNRKSIHMLDLVGWGSMEMEATGTAKNVEAQIKKFLDLVSIDTALAKKFLSIAKMFFAKPMVDEKLDQHIVVKSDGVYLTYSQRIAGLDRAQFSLSEIIKKLEHSCACSIVINPGMNNSAEILFAFHLRTAGSVNRPRMITLLSPQESGEPPLIVKREAS